MYNSSVPAHHLGHRNRVKITYIYVRQQMNYVTYDDLNIIMNKVRI